MGEFDAGKWLIGLTIYFFIFFTISFVSVLAANSVDIDHDIFIKDTGFTNINTIGRGDGCIGTISNYCGAIVNSNIETICSNFTGCTWDSGGNGRCDGTHNLSCADMSLNKNNCLALGCTFVEDEVSTTSRTLGTQNDGGIRKMLSFVTGFRAEIGVPPAFQFIYSFFFFWIPFAMFTYAFYMILPFIH